jgi:hypothetical protein
MSMSVGFNPVSPAQAPTPTRPTQRNEEDRQTALEKIRAAAKSGEKEEQKSPLKSDPGNDEGGLSTRQTGRRVNIQV